MVFNKFNQSSQVANYNLPHLPLLFATLVPLNLITKMVMVIMSFSLITDAFGVTGYQQGTYLIIVNWSLEFLCCTKSNVDLVYWKNRDGSNLKNYGTGDVRMRSQMLSRFSVGLRSISILDFI